MANFRGTVFGHLEGGETFNFTMHFTGVTGSADSMVSDFGDAVTLMWSGSNSPAGNITALYPAAIGVDGVRIDELDSNSRNVDQAVVDLALVGTGTGEALPPQNAVVVSLRTALPTRAGRGRFYLPSPVVSTVLNQKLDSSAQTDILNGALAMLEHMKTNAWIPIVYHRASSDGDNVTAIDVGNVYDNQRRRRNQLIETRVRASLP